MNNHESPYHVEPGIESREKERDLRVPIIDIVRHGQTDYKELKDPNFTFNPKAPDFRLDAAHLDLTEEGIRNILETAQQLVSTIDKEHEAVVLVSSPNYRAQSSILLIEKVLLENGVTVLNSSQAEAEQKSKGLKTSQALQQIEFNDKEFLPTWIAEDQKYRAEDPAHQKERPQAAHEAIATRLGKSVPEIFSKDHEQLHAQFQGWLRHMINIDHYLHQETKETLNNKTLRIVATSHEEVPDIFLHQSLNSETNMAKGQILEILAKNMLEAGASTDAEVLLYRKGESAEKAGHIAITYDPEKKHK